MMERIDRLLANRGYCARSEVWAYLRDHVVLGGIERLERENERVNPDEVTVDGERLDVGRLVILCHKPVGLICSHDEEEGPLIYHLFPPRWQKRRPALNTVGRLDKDTSGLLMITDDGQLLHRLVSPKNHVPRIYHVTLERPLKGDEAALFGSGNMELEGEKTPLLPAEMDPLTVNTARLALHEGRYHQVRRMFEATGNKVIALHRERFGTLTLGDLQPGQWRVMADDEVRAVAAQR